jgi:hypothetical protein
MVPGAAVFQQHAVVGTGEGDGQMPGLLPGAAELLMDGTAVAREAVRAVTGDVIEQPVVNPRPPDSPVL